MQAIPAHIGLVEGATILTAHLLDIQTSWQSARTFLIQTKCNNNHS